MSSDELFAHSTLSADDSRLFLLCDALCPYFPNVYLARLLENLSIRPGTGKRWDNASVLQTRKHFVKSKELYADTDWQKFKEEQLHFELSCQAAEQPEIVRALTVLLPQLGLSESVRRQWIYLLLFLKAFPKGTNVPPIEETPLIDVFVTVLPHVTFTHEWLDQRQPLAKRWICLENALFLLYEGTPWKSWGVVCDYMQDHVIEDLYHSHVYYAVIRILQGKDYNQENLTSGLNEKELCLLSACASLMKGEVEEAYQSFHGMAVDWSKQHSVQDYPVLPDFYGVLFYFAQLRHKQDLSNFIPTCKSIYRRFATWDDFTNESISYLVLQDLYTLRYGNTTQFTAAADYGQNEESKKYHLKHASLFTRLLFFHGALSCSDDEDMKWCKSAIALRDAYRDVFPLVYNLLNDLLREVGESSKENLPVAYDPWLSYAKGPEQWERQMNDLKELFEKKEIPGEKKRRLVWLLNTYTGDVLPYEQVLTARGKWSSGKRMNLNRLGDPDLTWMTDQDREMYSAVEERRFFWEVQLAFDRPRALTILCGHPLIFDVRDRTPLRLERRQVSLELEEENQQCRISLSCLPIEDKNFSLVNEGKGVIGLYIFSETQRHFSEILQEGMKLPTEELPSFLNVMQNMKNLEIKVKSTTERKPGDSVPVVQLWQQGGQYLASVRVRPSGDEQGTSYAPGSGREEILQVLDGKPVAVVRNLEEESAHASELVASCPTLESIDSHWDWSAEDLPQFFELISELKESAACRLEWPQGEKFKYVGTLKKSQISIRTKSQGNWFTLSGEAKVDELKVLQLSEILEHTNGKNRFVELKNGEFLALTDDVRRSLERLRYFSSKRSGQERVIHPLAGALVEDLCQDIEHESDVKWDDMIKGMRKAFELTPDIPQTLQAELRPYQISGYVWLCRLSEWGVGGCLADDMGLGKTIQAIAVMLREAQKGPCLIVAPTSVCPNWAEELNRFAPTLQVVRLKDAEDRKKAVNEMQPGMVMVAGYGLLPREQTLLAERQWQMVVFDEAQALKNNATKRSRAAQKIPAHFHLALTGTPIENHLEDLWSVFDIINPGLLGTLNDFHRRFVDAAEGGPSRAALKMLIRPFILRRMKNQVLDDLPELTEQTIIIEPTEKEASFYESIRRNALKHLHESAQVRNQMRFSILTELTRLRRACCHATLADPQAGQFVEPVSSKLLRFLELLDEARANGHRLLVFSQFTGHLALVRAELEKRGITYQYLDGSTPEEKRRQGVAAFQRGEGDAFLISLKAGGQGLNLTAADYVVHMDPWWNPAVEDQATDRAHRIGQKNTVTVYRLVMAHSVEEKILKLHARKRDLAADFLEGSDEAVTSATLSEEELLALLQ